MNGEDDVAIKVRLIFSHEQWVNNGLKNCDSPLVLLVNIDKPSFLERNLKEKLIIDFSC